MTSVKATFYVKTDVEGRRPGAQNGFDTQLVQAENYECYRLETFWCINESVCISPQE